MVEAEAREKIYPIMSTNGRGHHSAFCVGLDCALWDEWKTREHKTSVTEVRIPNKLIPHDPPQGICGMIRR